MVIQITIYNMENRTVTLMIRHRNGNGVWQRSPAARGGNGRVKPGHALIGGQAVEVKDGVYCLRMYENRKLVYVPAGKNAAAADAKRHKLEITATAKVVAEDAGLHVVVPPESRSLGESAVAYISDKEAQQFTEAAEQARNVSAEFIGLMSKKKKTKLDQIVKQDFYDYHAHLRALGLEDRTVSNKHVRLASWMTFAGIDKGIIPPKPKYVEKLPTIYDADAIRALLQMAAGTKMHLCMVLAWQAGLRDQELRHLEISDFNWDEETLRVQAKPKWKFKPKAWEERDIPLTDEVIAEVRKWQETRKGKTPILGTSTGKPDTKLLLALKIKVRQAGLNCGICDGCMGANRQCREFTLHRFRRTYITNLLRNNVDLRTAQAYAGHKDIESTMRYLRPAAGKEALAKLKTVKW